MKVFLSGPITGNENYKDEFCWAARILKAVGYEVFNPAYLPEGKSAKYYVARNLIALSKCDKIHFLPGAKSSKGSCIERGVANYLNIPTLTGKDVKVAQWMKLHSKLEM